MRYRDPQAGVKTRQIAEPRDGMLVWCASSGMLATLLHVAGDLWKVRYAPGDESAPFKADGSWGDLIVEVIDEGWLEES